MNTLKCIWLVFGFFRKENNLMISIKKTYLWFNLNNPMLGNVKPVVMIAIGRSTKLLKIIKNLLNGDI